MEDKRPEEPTPIWNKRPADEENLTPTTSKRRKHDSDIHDATSSTRPRLTARAYTVGWVCALPIEIAAAKSVLDEIHEPLSKSPDDTNTYAFGSTHHHNVVLACLPAHGYGTNNAAIVANNMRRTFPSIQTFLMVGIGGGAPGKVDVRLGDVVVSTGVIQYDLGKTIQEGYFYPTGIVCRPSMALRTAVSTLQARHESEQPKISATLAQIRERNPYMVPYTQCEQLQDLLFDSAYDHPEPTESCASCDRSRLLPRPPRHDSHPVIHYGVIASGNQVMRHGKTRDRLAQERDAICFEMEAAGLMDSLQCLVIRGICDYSDSHETKEWQRYASATAAAYAKELLAVIPISPTIETETTSNRELVRECRRLLMESLSFEKIGARHSDIKPAYGKTCAWLLTHPEYVKWSSPAEFIHHHGFLWIHGKPGAGKSTLMKYILTHSEENADTTISFFFNARGDSLEKSTEGMYRSLLLQLLQRVPDLQEVLDLTSRSGQRHGIDGSWEIHNLQSLFSAAVAKLGQRRITCFVDALDECGESQVRDMIEYFERLGEDAFETKAKLYICFSSRHYPTICIRNGQTLILEDQSGHSQDLEKYVRSKLQAGRGKDVDSVKAQLLEKAAGVFMWVVLVVNILNEEFRQGRIFAVKKRLQETPAELSALFRDILRRDTKNMTDLLLCIQWILYAKRPLKLEEFYYAMASGLDPEQESLVEWDPEYITADVMKRLVLSSSKGLAEVTKSNAKTVQFIHESVRDYLLKDGGIRDLWPDMDADFQSQSHDQLKNCCYVYTKTDISQYVSFDQQLPKASSDQAKALRQKVLEKFPFLEYATQQVLYHANTAAINIYQDDFLRTFDIKTWFNLNNLFEKYEIRRYTSSASLLYILAENNLARLIKTGLRYDSRIEIKGERYEYPLFAAVLNGHNEVVKLLLDKGANLESQDSFGRTPLSWAAEKGHKDMVQLLLDRGASLESKDGFDQTPLSLAAVKRHKAIVLLLFDKGVDLESKDNCGQTALSRAAENGHKDMVQLLLDKGVDLESKDNYGQTALSRAAEEGHKDIVQLLLDKGANLESKDKNGRTPLWWAAENGRKDIVQLLSILPKD